jgi:DNA-dependent RNA polymerase auxiliary subunit epsilon
MKIRLLAILCFLFFNILIVEGQVGGAYRVRIAALKMPFEANRFDNIKDLGILLFEPAPNGYTRVSLGTYLGYFSAEMVLEAVEKRGYHSPYIEKLPSIYQEPYRRNLTHTIQFVALSKLSIYKIYENPGFSNVLHDQLFISYHDGRYHISLGILEKDDEARITEFSEVADRMGFSGSILKAIYQHKNTNAPRRNKKQAPKASQESDVKLRPVKTPDNG